MKSLLRALSLLLKIIPACCLISTARAQLFEAPSPEIVSAWKLNSENLVAVFLYDGTYYLIDDDASHPGMERGTFLWNKDSGNFSADTIVDTNGDAGLSHPAGATSLSISGNTLNYTVAGEGTFPFSRIINGTTGNAAIVGSWVVPGAKICLTFLANGNYYIATEENDFNESPGYFSGMEKGTYVWNSSTTVITATATKDANGQSGLNDIDPAATVVITGNVMTFFDGEESTTLHRITTNLTPIRLPNFGIIRFANYRQSSSANPVFRTVGDLSPYSADASVDSEVGATAPTLRIGSGTPISIESDGDGGFDIEEEFPTLAALNAFLPASTTVQFKSGTATANLTTAASPTFPSIPKIIVREGDAWISGTYRFGESEVLQWTLPTGFVASQYVTVVNVYDNAADSDILSAVLQGEVTHFDLAGKLEPGKPYEIELEFIRIDSSTTAGSGVFSGKQGHLVSATSTIFNVQSLPATVAPQITEQPLSQPGSPGSPLLLTVGINEAAFRTATFQWFKNNQEIIGQTGNSLFIPSFNLLEDSGRYRVFVTNNEESVETEIANIGNVGTDDQHVQTIVAWKQKISSQQSASLLTAIGAAFSAGIEGPGITGTFPSSTITLTKPNNTSVPFLLDDDRWDAESDFANFTALQTAFPDGIYKINIGNESIPVNVSGANYPNQPLVTSSTGTWVSGKLQITASQAAAGFSLTSNSTTGDGLATLSVIDIATDNDLIYAQANTNPTDPSNTNFVAANIAPGQLTIGKSYEVETEFDEVVDFTALENKTWGAPEDGTASAFGLLSTTTVLTIEVIPDPSGNPYTTWKSSFFSSTQLANPAISGDDADFDNDGTDNLLEFILGGSPTSPNPNLLKNATTTPAAVGRNLVFFYDRKTLANTITQVIETSSTLSGNWTPAVHGVAGVVIATTTLDATTQRITATIPSSATKLFVRLKASR